MAASALKVISLGRFFEFLQPIQAFSLGSERSAPLGEPPSILFRPVLEIAGQAKMFCGVKSPERIEKHLTGKEDEVGTPILQDLLGKLRSSDHPDRAGWNPRFVADLFGKRHLVARTASKIGIGRSGTQIPTR